MRKNYCFAGVEFTVDIPDDRMYEQERNLEAFRAESVRDPHVFTFEIAQDLEAPTGECVAAPPGFRIYRDGECHITYVGAVKNSWEKGHLRILHRGKSHQVQVLSTACFGKISVKTVLNSLEAERLVTEANGFVFHCSYIAVGDRAIVFTAPSGTGKSTQADLWHQLRGAEIINGDRAVIRCVDHRVVACGIPFSGSSCYCENRELEIAAIVYLGQAPVTSIHQLRGYRAFARIWEGCSVNVWEPEEMAKVSDLAARVAALVPVYYLPCTPDETAVSALENALKEGK